MFVALGTGAYSAGIFHLFTHAAFKALLFLGAGAVIHALAGEQDIRKMGGLRSKLPFTYAIMVIGTLALTGFPLTAGYFSKDAIIEAAAAGHNPMAQYAFIMTVVAALLTSFYSWRLVFMTFHGKPADKHAYEHAHESPGVGHRESHRSVATRARVVRGGARRARHRFQVSVEEASGAGGDYGGRGMQSSKVVTILLVEDDEIDVKALRWAFDKLKIANPLVVARDGVEAWEMLQELSRPYLIITDINMPRMNGIELLRKIRESEQFRDSIVFALTTSNDEQDKIDAYHLNVAGYMLKTDMGTSFQRAIALIDNYWKVVEFPGQE
jgi:CheY-like chemotaxis protein